jgi:hypothetical protein
MIVRHYDRGLLIRGASGGVVAVFPLEQTGPDFSFGHCLDSSHHRMPCRTCSDSEIPVRALIDRSWSKISWSIMNVRRRFFVLATTPYSVSSSPVRIR